MRAWIPAIFLGILLLSSCVSKKKHLLTVADFEQVVDSLQQLNNAQAGRINNLELNLSRTQGANDALLLTQDRLQVRIDELQDQIQRLESNASSTQQDLAAEIRQRETEIAYRQSQLDAIQNLLIQRAARLQVVADSLRSKLSFLPEGQYDIRLRCGTLILSLRETILFRTGSTSRMEEQGQNALAFTVAVVNQFPEMVVEVIGHTDNQPINRQSLDNWQFSALR
ncbi:MAG: hypothetical protein KDC54_15580, partial [Lewinella sp.]|nr:hypothetical protein [Lewinella sp.]